MTRSTVSIDVEAPPERVFNLARDVERWPDLLPHYVRVRILDRHADGSQVARMIAIRALVPTFGFGVPVVWRARTSNEPATLGLRFVHLGGATAGMDVRWRIERTPGGCRVSIDHDFRPNLPRPVARAWAVLIDRLFVRPIATRTLRTFKGIAEATGEDRSNSAASTNPST